mmetsp:Transcript_8457/g.21743  ORF Transcript_8457/g.21743 Transcript_8457/m.21743 type:complete len:360 (+) Transcript_8457:161-1240(+)
MASMVLVGGPATAAMLCNTERAPGCPLLCCRPPARCSVGACRPAHSLKRKPKPRRRRARLCPTANFAAVGAVGSLARQTPFLGMALGVLCGIALLMLPPVGELFLVPPLLLARLAEMAELAESAVVAALVVHESARLAPPMDMVRRAHARKFKRSRRWLRGRHRDQLRHVSARSVSWLSTAIAVGNPVLPLKRGLGPGLAMHAEGARERSNNALRARGKRRRHGCRTASADVKADGGRETASRQGCETELLSAQRVKRSISVLEAAWQVAWCPCGGRVLGKGRRGRVHDGAGAAAGAMLGEGGQWQLHHSGARPGDARDNGSSRCVGGATEMVLRRWRRRRSHDEARGRFVHGHCTRPC